MKIGVIDAGGGLRGIYATGVFDTLLELGINFDIGLGVSAGSANITTYMAGQQKRNYRFYMDYSGRKEYMSLRNFIKKGSYMDLDYAYGTIANSDGEDPLDYPSFAKNPAEFVIVATNAITGEAKYFDKKDIKQDNYDVLKASCTLPFVCRPYIVDNIPYYDGAMSDPIPLEKAFSLGCDKVVLILTKPRDFQRTSRQDEKLAARIKKEYPKSAEGLCLRAKRYNEGVAFAKESERQGKVLIVAPDDTCGMSTLSRKADAMQSMYEKGKKDALKIPDFLKE